MRFARVLVRWPCDDDTVQASRVMHDTMVKSLLHRPMAFFDVTPVVWLARLSHWAAMLSIRG
jgi:hypothetical protein